MAMPEPSGAEVPGGDLAVVLDEELGRLPEHYRGAVVLCDLEGLTRKEAARRLGIPEGSVASRLARARALLARRLARRGVALGGGAAAALAAGRASASAPPALVASTIRAAGLLAAGKAAATGVISAEVTAVAASGPTASRLAAFSVDATSAGGADADADPADNAAGTDQPEDTTPRRVSRFARSALALASRLATLPSGMPSFRAASLRVIPFRSHRTTAPR